MGSTKRDRAGVVVFGEDEAAATRVGEWLGLSPLGIAASSVRNQAARLPGGNLVDVRLLAESTSPRAAWELVETVSAIFTRARMPASARERRQKVAFFLPSSRAVITFYGAPHGLFTPQLRRELAFRARGIVFEDDALTDARGRLVLSKKGLFDERAMTPREVIVLPHAGTANDDLEGHARLLTKRDLRLSSQIVPLADRDGPMNPHFRRLRSLPLGDGVERRRRLVEPYFASLRGLHVAADSPFLEAQLRGVVEVARRVDGLIADAWGVYDVERRALMNLIGMFDRSARLSARASPPDARRPNRFH